MEKKEANEIKLMQYNIKGTVEVEKTKAWTYVLLICCELNN